tara:strand:+ start:63 stop:893 length:831 start_codon:yes stop_codon:yes gene_type:complete
MIGGCPDGPFPEPKYVKYVRNQPEWDGITYFTDKELPLAASVKSKYKIGILFEPREFMPQIYKNIKIYEDFYDFIFTFDEKLLKRNPKKYFFSCASMPHIELKSCKLQEKTKLVSMIYSHKKFLSGHKLRYVIANELIPKINFSDKIDLFGTGANRPLRNKADGCNQYMFQIAIENSKINNYWTEKILDCFITGCVPIYWGAPNVGNWFDDRGILSFETPKQLAAILKSLSKDKYDSMKEYIVKNYELAKKYQYPDDNIYLNVKDRLRKNKINRRI